MGKKQTLFANFMDNILRNSFNIILRVGEMNFQKCSAPLYKKSLNATVGLGSRNIQMHHFSLNLLAEIGLQNVIACALR